MSIVLQFPIRPHPRSQSADEQAGSGADILFFTGVRIERHTEDDKVNGPQRGGSANGRRRRKA
jgi:hypothetical protein